MSRYPLSVWIFALVLAVITSLPYIVGALSTPEGWQYSGAAALPPGIAVDYNSHMAKMWQGRRGEWDYHLLFTHEPHPGLPLVQGFYVALGAVSPFSLPATYHLMRFVLTIGMVLALWSFAAHFFDKPSERWTCLLFATLVSGWSWLLRFVPGATDQVSPIEFWLIDAYNLPGALFMPHFAAAIILQIVAFLSFEWWVRKPSRKLLFMLTFALAALSIVQPYIILLSAPLLVMLTAYHSFSTKLLTRRRALWLLLPLGLHVALIGYQYLAINADPIWREFSAQNITLSPNNPLFYVFGYLPFIIPIVLGMWAFALDKSDDRWWLPLLWIIIVAGLLYAPINTQRRYLLGVQTPLAALAAYGWTHAIMPRFGLRWRPLVTGIYITFAAIALVLMILSNITTLSNPYAPNSPFYTYDELIGYAWLQREADDDDLVLTTFDENGQGSGGRLVAATGQRVFMGHWIETVYFDEKVAQIRTFFNPLTDDIWRQNFLRDAGVIYVWYDDYARALGNWNPSDASYLEVALVSGTVTIYRVVGNG